MIEGGLAGGSALSQAAQRRATAERLVLEAQWLEALAADERAIARQLATLPTSYALLHDLKLPGSKGNIDHLVIGPGGAFVVVTRRCQEAISFRDGQLWSGDLSLRDLLDAARVESQLLTQTVGTPVVPVVTIIGVLVSASLPNAVDGVLLCSAEDVVRVVTRGSHTLLPPHKVSEAAERALPLLHNPGSVPRTEAGPGARVEPGTEASFKPAMPPSSSPAETAAKRVQATESAVNRGRATSAVEVAAPAEAFDVRRAGAASAAESSSLAPATKPTRKPTKERSGRSRSVGFIVGALLVLCVVAIGIGSLVGGFWGGDDDGGADITSVDSSPDSTLDSTVATTTPASSSPGVTPAPGQLASGLAAPTVAFSPLCPALGAGWQMQPVWPGDLAGLVQYDIELAGPDGSWVALAPLPTASTPWGSLVGQSPGNTLTIRITAVMTDASRSINQPTTVVVPPESC